MASNFLQLNIDELEITIPSQKGSYTESNGRFYATRSYSSRSAAIRAYLPSALNNAELNSLNFSFQVKGTGNAWRYTKDEDILSALSGEDHYADISFIYAPAAETKTFTIREDAIDWVSGGSGKKTFKWSNISIEVDYTSSITPVSTLIYSFDKASLAKGESIGLKVDYTPSSEIIVDDAGIKAYLYCIGSSEEIQWGGEQVLLLKSEQASISSNSPMHSTATFTIDTEKNLNGSWEINIINGEDSLLTNGAEAVTFSYVNQRNITAPVELRMSTGTYYSNITEPTANFSLVLDPNVNIKQIEAIFYTTVDNVIQEFAREIADGKDVYNTGDTDRPFGIKFSPLSVSEETIITKIDFKVTDDYNERNTRVWPASGSSATRTVVPYNPPTFGRDFNIQRYTTNAVGQIEPSMLGQNLITLGTINISSNTNERRITINWIDKDGNNQTITPDISSYSDDQIIFDLNDNPQACVQFFNNQNFSLVTNFNITCTLHDGISPDVVQTFTIPKSTTYFNIEKTGVSIGGFSTGEIIKPIFECYYPMYLYFNNKKYAITIDSNGFIKGVNTEGDAPSIIDIVTVESSTLKRVNESSNKYFYLDSNLSTITNELSVARYLIHFEALFQNKTNDRRQFRISTNLFNDNYYNLGELESYNTTLAQINWDVGIYNNNNNTIAQLIENLKIYVYGTYSGSFQAMAGADFFSQIEITFTPQT